MERREGTGNRRLPEESSEFQEINAKNTIEGIFPRDEDIFGLKEANELEIIENDPLGILEKPGKKDINLIDFQDPKIAVLISSLKQKLSGRHSDGKFIALLGFVKLSLEDPELKKKLDPYVKHKHDSLERFDILDSLPELPDRIFLEMLIKHIEWFKEIKKKFEPVFVEKARLFKNKLIRFSRGRNFPVSEEIMEKRIRETSIHIIDGLAVELDENIGEYKPRTARVNISGQITKNNLDQTIAHEMLHAVSGRTSYIETLPAEKYPGTSERQRSFVVHQRLGTYFRKGTNWLNEAITEKLTLRILELKDSNSYPEERKLLELLISKGIPEKFLYNAYFENYDPNHPDRVPHWKKLVQSFSEIFEPAFLQKLNTIVKENGIEKAIQWIEDREQT